MTQPYTPGYLIERMTIQSAPDPGGHMVPYRNFACYDFRDDTPDRPDSREDTRWPIIAEYTPNVPRVVWYYEGAFRSSNGYAWGIPPRWAYYRGEEEVWHPEWQQWVIPGVAPVAPPAVAPTGKAGVHMDATQGQWMVDDLKRSFTTQQIMDMMDASPYDEPDTGAPEVMG